MKKLIYYKEGDRWVIQLDVSKPYTPCIVVTNKHAVKDLDDIYDILHDADLVFGREENEKSI